MLIKYIFIVAFIFVSNSYATMEKIVAQLANDSYLPKSKFIAKYKSSTTKITALRTRSVNYYLLTTKDNTLIVVFQGSKNLHNWTSNLNIGEIKFLNSERALVHRGFYEEALTARNRVREHIGANQKIIVVGHSLGGAIALLFSSMLTHDGYNVLLFTFGSPPVGNKNFIDSMSALQHMRYTHIFDIVPKMKKKYIDKVKHSLLKLNIDIQESRTIKNLLKQIDSISYNYVHHGKHISLHNLEALPLEYEHDSFPKKMLLKTLMYHSAQTYLNGIKKTNNLFIGLLKHFF